MKPMMQDILTPMMADLMPLFNPAESGAGLWLDAADASTITIGTGISQWSDKSGKARNATQAAGGNQPTYNTPGLNGLNTVEFPGAQWFDMGTGLDFLGGGVFPTNHTAFIVTRRDNSVNIYGAANGGNGSNSLHIGFNGGNYRVNYWGNDYGTARTANFNEGSYNRVRYVWDDATGFKSVYANGSLEGTGQGSGGGAGTIGTMLGGGRIGNVVGQGIYDGAIAEIIMYPFIASAALVAQTEAYLAAKWGL